MNPYNSNPPTVYPTNNGVKLKREFMRVASLCIEATGLQPSAAHSFRDASGLWECRNARAELIAEVHGDQVTVAQVAPSEPSIGLLERISDLRRAGLSTNAVLGWFGERRLLDPTAEAALCVQIAVRLNSERSARAIAPKVPKPPVEDPWRLAR